ncbi:MAG: hypothetical protein J1F43_04405 [Muribaculaceae bacterium]|nr:hypothetical protein [Muribaculaceae bacterium]
MKKRLEPTVENSLRLFSKRLAEFKGESRRGYRKAYSSLQVYLISNYMMGEILNRGMIENWVFDNLMHGLSKNTVGFYLDKVSSLYSSVAHKFNTGKLQLFKDVKIKLKHDAVPTDLSDRISRVVDGMRKKCRRMRVSGKNSLLIDAVRKYGSEEECSICNETQSAVAVIWSCLALGGGVRPDLVKGMLRDVDRNLNILDFCEAAQVDDKERERICKLVADTLYGEEIQWFAMRLRPGVKYDDLISRFASLNGEVSLPELFYPSEEIARRVGRKVVWKGRPVIRDVVFFRHRKSEIYPLFTRIYDLAWCYRQPGNTPGNYASIPAKAMDNFMKAIGLLHSGFDVAPQGEMILSPGDEVIIIDGNSEERARILRKATPDEDGNKIYRVTLLDRNSRWDIGVDARLIRKP